MYKEFHIFIFVLTAIFACSEDDVVEPVHVRRTIIAYITADNNISSQLQDDVTEMIEGSKKLPSDCRLILFNDNDGDSENAGRPYIAEIKNGSKTVLREYANDFYSTSADKMVDVMQYIVDQCPADEYALILTGHGSGSLVNEDTIPTTKYTKLYAYGGDNNGGSTSSIYKWMNIPSIATVLSNLKDKNGSSIHFDYIFFDCCCMQSVEVAYELRNYTDYIIAPASETPAKGAPYTSVVPILGNKKDGIGAEIINQYIENTNWGKTGGIAISAVKTSEVHRLMELTRYALQTIYDGNTLVMNTSNCIYYYRGEESGNSPVLYDMKNLMLINLTDNNLYAAWLEQFNKTVVAKHSPIASTPWYTNIDINFYAFNVTEENYGGMSMFVPRAVYDIFPTYQSLNQTMFSLEWTNAVGWKELGW